MDFAELVEYAASLGVETNIDGVNRPYLFDAIRRAQQSGTRGHPESTRVHVASARGSAGTSSGVSHVTVHDLASDLGEAEWTVVDVNDEDIELIDVDELRARDALAGPPPPVRMLSMAALLLAPEERENWLGELRTARWELRGDPRARRAVTRSFFGGLGASLVASWRHSGAPARGTS